MESEHTGMKMRVSKTLRIISQCMGQGYKYPTVKVLKLRECILFAVILPESDVHILQPQCPGLTSPAVLRASMSAERFSSTFAAFLTQFRIQHRISSHHASSLSVILTGDHEWSAAMSISTVDWNLWMNNQGVSRGIIGTNSHEEAIKLL